MLVDMKPNLKLILILSLALLVLIGVVAIMLNPLFKSEERIRKDVLKQIPLGTSLEDA